MTQGRGGAGEWSLDENGALIETRLADLRLVSRGKVRDMYELGEHLLIVTSDRISAFDWVLPTGIPDKGKVLNQLSAFWFDVLTPIVPTHLLSTDVAGDRRVPTRYHAILEGRAMVVRKAAVFPVECVVRGYLAGSGWRDYQTTGAVCGIPLPPGLTDGSRLPEPIFTPTTKAALGEHDTAMTFEEVVGEVGAGTAEELRKLTLEVYRRGAELAADREIGRAHV